MVFSPDGNTLATASADATVRLWQAPPLSAALREPAETASLPPVETIRLFFLRPYGTAQARLAAEGNVLRVDVTAVDGTNWHANLSQVFDDLQEGATYIISGEWWVALFPGAVLMLAVFTFNLLGDGLRDLLDPRMRT